MNGPLGEGPQPPPDGGTEYEVDTVELGDVETFVYLGMPEEAQERWYESNLNLATKGERLKVPFDSEDSPEDREAKEAEIRAGIQLRKQELDKDLNLMDFRTILCGVVLEKGVPTEVDFRKFIGKDRAKAKSKFGHALKVGRVELATAAESETEEPADPETAVLMELSRDELNERALALGIESPEKKRTKGALVEAILGAQG